MNDNIGLKIHDIKDLVEIPDNSIFLFILLCFISVLIIFAITLLIIKIIKNKKVNVRKEHFEILKNIDFSDSKKAAYSITKSIRFLANNEREKNLGLEIIDELETYKYKKNVVDFDNSLKIKLDRFLDIVDV